VCGIVAACVGFSVIVPPQTSDAEPILKPRKYHGPIPKRYFTLGIGVMGGADNEEMWDLLDRQVISTFKSETDTKDFGASLCLDGSYTVKVHPQFAFRGRAALGILRSESTGKWKPATETSTFSFEREFNVWLFSLDATGIYYFQDASVKAFQTYAGAGLGAFFPYSIFHEVMTDDTSGEAMPEKKLTEWDVEPDAHVILGFLYHISPVTAFGMEGRLQMGLSKFSLKYEETTGTERTASFDVDYTGFVLNVFAAKFF
jgi:hypothetical protein